MLSKSTHYCGNQQVLEFNKCKTKLTVMKNDAEKYDNVCTDILCEILYTEMMGVAVASAYYKCTHIHIRCITFKIVIDRNDHPLQICYKNRPQLYLSRLTAKIVYP